MRLPDFDDTFNSLDKTFQSDPKEVPFHNNEICLDTEDRYSYEAAYWTLLTGVRFTRHDIKLHRGLLPLDPPDEVHDKTYDSLFKQIKPIPKQISTRQQDWNRLFNLNRHSQYNTLKSWNAQGRGGYPLGFTWK